MGAGGFTTPALTDGSHSLVARVAISSVASLSKAISGRGVSLHAEAEQTRSCAAQLIPKFEVSATDPLHLLLLPKDIRRTLSSLPG